MYLKSDDDAVVKRTGSLKDSLTQLRQDHNLNQESVQAVSGDTNDNNDRDNEKDIYDDYSEAVRLVGNDTSTGPLLKVMDDYEEERWTDDPAEFEEYDEFAFQGDDDDDDKSDQQNQIPVVNLISKESSAAKKQEEDHTISLMPPPNRDDAFVVLIRHGRTPHNNLGLFTGWEDPPLAEGGVEDARNAGRLLKRHGFEFDVVYTSWLTRAIQTAYYAMDELDCVWLPIVKSWRLNERMYGDLTGKSKKMIANEYGEEQLKKWRRGFAIRPPPTSSYSTNYPGNVVKRTKHFTDLPYSLRETLNRSLEQRKLVLHRKFPKTESLEDCMARSIPFYTERIRKDAVDKGKRVLITSHENAIRG
jgi:2,3-bisphosphoglycerate-dependent phosphoglycerate mutase